MISRVISGMSTGASAEAFPVESSSLISRKMASCRLTSNGLTSMALTSVFPAGAARQASIMTEPTRSGGKFQAEAEVRPLLGCIQDLAYAGQLDGRDQVLRGVIAVAAVAQKDFLAPLSNHAKGRLDYAVHLLQRHGGAVQVQPIQRLGVSIFGQDLRDAFNQFLAVGLHSRPFTILPAGGSFHP